MAAIDDYLHAVIMRAEVEARTDGSSTIEAAHMFLAVAGHPEPTVHSALNEFGLDLDSVRAALDREFVRSLDAVGVASSAHQLPPPTRLTTHPKMGTTGKLVLERAFTSARKKDLRPAHVLLGILAADVGAVPRALAMWGVDRERLAARVRREID